MQYFWQHRNFGSVHVIGNLHVLGLNFSRSRGQVNLSYALNFMTFENVSQKLWASMLFFPPIGQSDISEKLTFFKNKKFEIGFPGSTHTFPTTRNTVSQKVPPHTLPESMWKSNFRVRFSWVHLTSHHSVKRLYVALFQLEK